MSTSGARLLWTVLNASGQQRFQRVPEGPQRVGLWQHNMVGGSLQRARTLGTELLDIANAVDDPTFRLIAMRSLGHV